MSVCLDYLLPRNPVTGYREIQIIPECAEIALGNCLYQRLVSWYGGEFRDPRYDALVKNVGAKISQVSDRNKLPFKFTVIDTQKSQAWCLPGGKIAISRGLLKRMEQEKNEFGVGKFSLEEKVAAILSHEIVHAAARHTANGLELTMFLMIAVKVIEIACPILGTTVLGMLLQCVVGLFSILVLFYDSRQNEREADHYGMVYLQRAGYNPRVAIWLQEFFATCSYSYGNSIRSWFATHPDSKERAQLNRATLDNFDRSILV